MSSSKCTFNEVNDWAQRLSSANLRFLRVVKLPIVMFGMVVMIVDQDNVQALQMQTTTVMKFSSHITEL